MLNNLKLFKNINYTAITDIFTKEIYKITSVPNSTTLGILNYIDNNVQYFIDPVTKIKQNTKFNLVDGIQIVGYYDDAQALFYSLYIIAEDISISENSELLSSFSQNNNFEILEFYDNIIEEAYELLQQSSTRLIFVPDNLQGPKFIFDKDTIPSPIVVQIIQRTSGALYNLGYNDMAFNTNYYKIPFVPSSANYIMIKGNYNLVTKKLSVDKPLEFVKIGQRDDISFEKAKSLFNELLDPIDKNFFTVNDGEKLEINDITYEYSNMTGLLVSN